MPWLWQQKHSSLCLSALEWTFPRPWSPGAGSSFSKSLEVITKQMLSWPTSRLRNQRVLPARWPGAGEHISSQPGFYTGPSFDKADYTAERETRRLAMLLLQTWSRSHWAVCRSAQTATAWGPTTMEGNHGVSMGPTWGNVIHSCTLESLTFWSSQE